MKKSDWIALVTLMAVTLFFQSNADEWTFYQYRIWNQKIHVSSIDKIKENDDAHLYVDERI